MYRRTANWTDVDEGIEKCAKHELLLGNLYADFAPWVDLGLRIEERQMAAAINFAEKRRGKWNSWVTDSFTPILIKDGRIYLTLGPPLKDPTNYFWTVLSDLQLLSRTTRLPDAELLLNIPFTASVRLRGLCVSGGEAPGGRPTRVRLFANSSLDIGECAAAAGTQELALPSAVTLGVSIVPSRSASVAITDSQARSFCAERVKKSALLSAKCQAAAEAGEKWHKDGI
jgi:hypothetical protein